MTIPHPEPRGDPAPLEPFRLPPPGPLADPRARLVLELVGYATALPAETLGGRRFPAPLATARYVALYLYSTVFSLNATDTGRAFGRDRTTVQNALRRIEKARDAPAFDAWLQTLETILHLTPKLGGRA